MNGPDNVQLPTSNFERSTLEVERWTLRRFRESLHEYWRLGTMNRPGMCLLLFLGLWTPVQGAVRFDVFVGYDGVVPEASWFPVTCEVQNDGPGFNAQFELTSGAYSQGQTRRLLVELPTGTTKRFILPVFSAQRYNATWDARLLDEKGHVRAEQQGLRVRRQLAWRVPFSGP